MLLARIILLNGILLLLSATIAAQSTVTPEPSPTPNQSSSEDSKKVDRDPIEKADEYKSKLTFGVYFTPGHQAFDLNLRHQLGPFTVWIAGFYDPQESLVSFCSHRGSLDHQGPNRIALYRAGFRKDFCDRRSVAHKPEGFLRSLLGSQ